MKKISILGTNISLISRTALKEDIEQAIVKPGKSMVIVTPNPEFVLMAYKDKDFQALLNSADIAVCDGIGLRYAAWYLRKPLPDRITGSDLMQDILIICQKSGGGVFGVCADGGLSSPEEIEAAIAKRFPSLRFQCRAFASEHPLIQKDKKAKLGKGISNEELIHTIREFQPDVVFVGLGQREQERWIFANKNKLSCVRLFMGIGGSFDFLTKKRKRAPWIFRSLGIEWVWRMILQPKRASRIWRAFVVFTCTVVLSRFRKTS